MANGVPSLYGLDIETDTSRDGFDPTVAAVVAVALATSGGTEVWTGPEPAILRNVDAALGSLAPGVVVTWNGSRFDLPFLSARAAFAGVELALRMWPVSEPDGEPSDPAAVVPVAAIWGSHRHLDACRGWKRLPDQLGLSRALKSVASRCGFDALEVDRAALHLLPALQLERYVASDAEVTRALACSRWDALADSVDGEADGEAEVDVDGTVDHAGLPSTA